MGGKTSGFPPPAAGRAVARGGPARGEDLAASRAGWRRIDDPLLHRERLAALGELVAEVVHEIRNPLVVLKTFVQLLPERGVDEEFRNEFGALAGEELERVERLIGELLAHARPTSARASEPEPGDVAAQIASVLRLVRQRALALDVELEWQRAEALPRVALGADPLRQVLLNLLLNALEATPARGSIRVSARPLDDGVALEVEDGGPGIPEALRERVFEPFFSTGDGRAGGLWLAIVRRLVEQARGRVEIREAASSGTRFEVWLPRAD